MALAAADIPALITAEDAIIYNTLAASMFIFWEHCITFNEEVDLIWRAKKWGTVNTLFVVMRYMAFSIRIVELVFYTNVFGLIRPSTSQCIAWLRFEAASGYILFFCVEVVLMMRVFAFYGRNRLLLVTLLALFACESAARITILGITMPNIVIVPNPLPPHLHAGACLIVSVPSIFSNYWVPGLIFESILFLLVVYQFIQTKRHAEIGSPHVLIVFVRDGAWAFSLIFAFLLWSALSYELTPVKGDVALTWVFSVLGFCGPRLILNLRSAGVDSVQTIDEDPELEFQREDETGTSGTGYTTASESKYHQHHSLP
ncbi:hypothetical protein JB92DRAFT_2861729 [Gautieria morchelliformis]|nr:hypothetical protein JB92DRAFT_2861729 [Gautieria morchelliformis]